MKNIWADINAQFLSIDNHFLKTFVHLFTQPETVINGFIEGTRKKYINVIQYFAISLTLVGIQVFLMNTFFQEDLDSASEIFTKLQKSQNSENNPFNDFNFYDYNNYQSVIYILSIPISTIATWLAYFILGSRRFNFTEHLVLNVYYYAQVIFITAVLSILFLCFGLNYLVISGFVSVLIYVYLFYVLHRVFHTSFWDTALHFILTMAILVVIFIGLMLLSIIIGVLYAMYHHEAFNITI
ncbi:DUF3667 domain-containing protein [Psychroserpens sp. BH13MA-6]